jgi:membrane fusion protein, heavy metal efflux system
MVGMHVRRGRIAAIMLGIGLVLAGTSFVAWADEDEDAPASPTAPPDPRLAAEGDLFELVGVAKGDVLTIYLDRFADNDPVAGATIEIDAGDGQTAASTPAGEGVYTVTGPWVAQPGRHDLVFTVHSDQGADLLGGTLGIPAPGGGGIARASFLNGHPSFGVVGAFVLGLLTMFGASRLTASSPFGSPSDDVEPAAASAGFAGLGATVAGAATRFAQSPMNAIAELAARRRRPQPHPRRRARATAGAEVGPVATRGEPGKRSAFAVAVAIYLIVMALFLAGRSVLAREADALDGQDSQDASALAGNIPHRLLDGTIYMPKTTQRLLTVRTAVTAVSNVERTVRVVGQVIPDPGTSGQIHATIRGRLEPFGGKWPKVGDTVEASQVLASVVPVVTPIDRGIIMQQVAQIDRSIGIAQDRLRTLGSAAASRETDDARAELANLIRRRDAIAAVLRDRDTLRAPLLAPSTGVIAASFAVAGQIVDEQQKLFEVVDLKRLWVEAYAYDVSGMGKVSEANAVGPTGKNYRLKFMSRGPQLHKQTIPLYFAVDDPDANLSVGSLVSVLIGVAGGQAGNAESGIVLPRSAVVRDTSNQDIVWIHSQPELFSSVPVRIRPIDGDKVLVASGLDGKMRVVTDGANLLNEVR